NRERARSPLSTQILARSTQPISIEPMIARTPKNKLAALLLGLISLNLLLIGRAGEMNTGGPVAKENRIEIKDFAFNPQTITVKSGEKVTWINWDEEPHTIVSVGKQFKKSTAL